MGAEMEGSEGKIAVPLPSRRTGGGAVPGDLKTWLLRNRLCGGPATLTLDRVPSLPLSPQNAPTQCSRGPGLIPERPGSEPLSRRAARPALGLTLPSCLAQSRGGSPAAFLGRVGRVSQLSGAGPGSILGTC